LWRLLISIPALRQWVLQPAAQQQQQQQCRRLLALQLQGTCGSSFQDRFDAGFAVDSLTYSWLMLVYICLLYI